MLLRQKKLKVLTMAGALGVVAASLAQVPSAGASIYNINQWKASWCRGSAFNWCLYYGQGGQNSDTAWAGSQNSVPNLSSPYDWTFTSGEVHPVLPGNGQQVRNNAASMEDGTPNCNVTTWVYPNYVGDYNYLNPGEGGNLTPNSADPQQLRNNEASISVNSCS